MSRRLRLGTAKFAPMAGLGGLFLAAAAFSLTGTITERHFAVTAVLAGGVLAAGGLSILRDPQGAAVYDTALTAIDRDATPSPSAVTLMLASGLALVIGGALLVAMAIRLL